jgi:putative ABC transport system permease protein
VPDANFDKLVVDLRADFATSSRGALLQGHEDDIGEEFTRAENYLSLVGLVIVILGGIGVSSVTRVFVQQKMKSIAVLKCVGARSSQLLAIYVAQVAVLGLAGSLLGVCSRAGDARDPVVAGRRDAGVEITYALTCRGAAGLGIGLLVSLLFSLVPLLDVRHVKPSLLLRDEARSHVRTARRSSSRGRGRGPGRLTVWQAGSLRIGSWWPAVCRHGDRPAPCRHAADAAIRPLARSRSFALRHAVLQLSRPGSQMRSCCWPSASAASSSSACDRCRRT